MAVFNATNPVAVSAATKKDHYDRAFDNILALKQGDHPFDFLRMDGRSAPSVSASGDLSMYMGTDFRLHASRNGGAYQPVTLIDQLLAGLIYRMPLLDRANAVTAGAALTSATPTIYTAGGAVVTIVRAIKISNSDSSAREVKIHIIPSGGSPSVANTLYVDRLPARSSFAIPLPWFLDPSDTVRGIADADNVVGVRVDAIELSAQPDRCTLKVIDGSAPASSGWTAIYTMPGSGVSRAVLVAVAQANSSASLHTVSQMAMAGTGVANLFHAEPQPSETSILLGGALTLATPSTSFSVHRDSTSWDISTRMSVIELQ